MAVFYGYVRASTVGQEYTFEVQRNKIQQEYERAYRDKGFSFGGFFEDKATSGSKPFLERKAGGRLWGACARGDVVCVSKMDRAFRNVLDAAGLLRDSESCGVVLVFLDLALDTGTSLGKFVAHLLASVAELEREWIRQRTKEALQIRKQKGLPHAGRPPAGWMKCESGKWVHDETERKLLDWVFAMHSQHGWSYGRIAAHLKARGIVRANGHGYHQSWIACAVRARAAGYPGRDGWRATVRESRRAARLQSPGKH